MTRSPDPIARFDGGWRIVLPSDNDPTVARRLDRVPLYGVHGVKRHLLRADAVCWTGLGAASLLSGRRSAAPPCIRSALTGCLTNIPPTWAMRGRESRTHL